MAIPNDGAGHGPEADAELSAKDRARARMLLDFLKREATGEGNARTVVDVAAQVGCSARKVRTLVTFLRVNGHPVLATPGSGYFWPATREEAEHTLAFLTARVTSTLRVRDGIAAGLAETFPDSGQLSLAA